MTSPSESFLKLKCFLTIRFGRRNHLFIKLVSEKSTSKYITFIWSNNLRSLDLTPCDSYLSGYAEKTGCTTCDAKVSSRANFGGHSRQRRVSFTVQRRKWIGILRVRNEARFQYLYITVISSVLFSGFNFMILSLTVSKIDYHSNNIPVLTSAAAHSHPCSIMTFTMTVWNHILGTPNSSCLIAS